MLKKIEIDVRGAPFREIVRTMLEKATGFDACLVYVDGISRSEDSYMVSH